LENQNSSGRDAPRLSTAIWGIFAVTVLLVLYIARTFLLPFVVAVLLTFLFRPVVRALNRIGVPYTLGAAMVLAGLLGGLSFAGYHFLQPAADWLQRAPEIFRQLSGEAARLKEPLAQVSEAAEEADKLAEVKSAPEVPVVQVKDPDASEMVMAMTWQLLLSIFMIVVLLYFLLASGDDFVRRMTDLVRLVRPAEQPERVAVSVERQVSRYLFTIAVINLILGSAVASLFWILGMPDPALWGALAGVLNFIPYAGAIIAASIFTLVAAAAFQDVSRILLIPGAYVALTAMEGFLIQPAVVGRRLILNPVAILLSFMFWGWVWGIPGLILAVPILVVLKTLHEEAKVFAAIGILVKR
jgi:predicted PurR-regulated permease PerM